MTNVAVEEDLVHADYIDSGYRFPARFSVDTASDRIFVNSDQLLRRSELPSDLLIVGGGYIGCEFASIFRALGSNVTLVEKSRRLLPDWDESVGDFIGTTLRSSGVDVHLGFELDVSETCFKGCRA